MLTHSQTDLIGSSYQNPQEILNTAQSTQASGLNLHPNSYMSTKVGGKRRMKNKTKKGGDCGCNKGLSSMFKGGAKKGKRSIKNKRNQEKGRK